MWQKVRGVIRKLFFFFVFFFSPSPLQINLSLSFILQFLSPLSLSMVLFPPTLSLPRCILFSRTVSSASLSLSGFLSNSTSPRCHPSSPGSVCSPGEKTGLGGVAGIGGERKRLESRREETTVRGKNKAKGDAEENDGVGKKKKKQKRDGCREI